MRTARVLLTALLGFFLAENLVFRTCFYANIISPDSSAGNLESIVENEIRRPVGDRNQVLAVGDSRMGGFLPRYADEMKKQLGYTFATVAVPGCTPRCWYYILRDVDPTARRYAAVVIGVDDYDDAEAWEDRADRITDLHFLIARLRLKDLREFSGSYHAAHLKRQAALGILFKGSIHKTDFQDFLLDPVARLQYAAQSHRDSRHWLYDYAAPKDDVTGVRFDWTKHTVTAPPRFTAAQTAFFRGRFLDPRAPDIGRESAYRKHWFGRVYDHYKGSGTRLIFIRLPRGPFIRPDQPPVNPDSSVRRLAKLPGVILDQEHAFDVLEQPELFLDPAHLNGPGSERFSRMLAERVRDLLAPAPAAGTD